LVVSNFISQPILVDVAHIAISSNEIRQRRPNWSRLVVVCAQLKALSTPFDRVQAHEQVSLKTDNDEFKPIR